MSANAKQYSVLFEGFPIEFTGYFKSVQDVRSYLKARYSDTKGLTFKAVYPKVETKVYSV